MQLTLQIYADIKSFKESVLINSELRLAEINKNNYYFMPVFFNACILFSTIFSRRKMMKRSVEINTFIHLFSYDPISTILNLMKYKKITQIQISNYIQKCGNS